MKLASSLKVPFGTAKMFPVTGAKYLSWEDAFEVDFEDGLSFLEPHATIRKANRIAVTQASGLPFRRASSLQSLIARPERRPEALRNGSRDGCVTSSCVSPANLAASMTWPISDARR